MFLVHKKLCQAKMGMIGKKLKKQFVYFFALKKPKNCVLEKLENKTFAKKLFHTFSIDKRSISQRNLKQALS